MKTLDLYLTKICNLDCEYCYVDVVKSESQAFPTDQFIERVNLLEYDIIKFFGGEPLVKWKEIQQIVKHVRKKSKHIQFVIVTNGILLDQKKIDYILSTERLEVVVSIHEWSYKTLRRQASTLLQLGNRLWFYIIFDPKNFTNAVWKFLFFSRLGFTHFSFVPEIYGDWNKKNLIQFESILMHLIWYILKHNISISGSHIFLLKEMNYGCDKTVYDHLWNFSPCNRFKSLSNKKGFNYKTIYDYLDQTIAYKTHPDRWFYTCPVGWHLDNEEEDMQASIISYQDLNDIMLRFYRKVCQWTVNFLSLWIQEIRFNLTQQCNIRCEYCYVDFSDSVLDYTTAINIVDFFFDQPWDVKTFSFFGWEPLLEFSLMEKIVWYIEQQAREKHKSVVYKIATNFILVNRKIIDFFVCFNFQVHISFNGMVSTNDVMRDASSDRVLRNIQKYKDIIWVDNIVILCAISPHTVQKTSENLIFIHDNGIGNINLEIIFWKGYAWKEEHIQQFWKQLHEFIQKYPDMIFENTKTKHLYLDIDTDGRAAENSLQFFGSDVDTYYKSLFDKKILHVTSL